MCKSMQQKIFVIRARSDCLFELQNEGHCYVTVTNSGDNAPSSFGLGAQFMEKYLSVFVYPTDSIAASVCFMATVPVRDA